MTKQEIINKIINENYNNIVNAYASMLYQICNDIKPWDNIDCEYAGIAYETNHDIINEVLHKIHCIFPQVREDAIKRISDEFNHEVRVIFCNHFVEKYSEIKPIKKVEKILDCFKDDIVYKYGMTYYNDHNMQAAGYTQENVMIIIDSADTRTTDYIISIFQEKFRDSINVM